MRGDGQEGSNVVSSIRRWQILWRIEGCDLASDVDPAETWTSLPDGGYADSSEIIVGNPSCDPIALNFFPTYQDFYDKKSPRTYFVYDKSHYVTARDSVAGLQLLVDVPYDNRWDLRATLSPRHAEYPGMVMALNSGSPDSSQSPRQNAHWTSLTPKAFPIYCPDDDSGRSIAAAANALLSLYFERSMPCTDWSDVIAALHPKKSRYALSFSGSRDAMIQTIRDHQHHRSFMGGFMVMFADDNLTMEEYSEVNDRIYATLNDDAIWFVAIRGRPANIVGGVELPYATVFMSFAE